MYDYTSTRVSSSMSTSVTHSEHSHCVCEYCLDPHIYLPFIHTLSISIVNLLMAFRMLLETIVYRKCFFIEMTPGIEPPDSPLLAQNT